MADRLAEIKAAVQDHANDCGCVLCWAVARVEELERRLVEQREQAHG